MTDYIERGPTDCWLWQKDPKEAPNKSALMACRNPLCCNPRHVVKIEKGVPNVIWLVHAGIEEGDKDALEAYARDHLDIELDKRKKFGSLLETVQKAENGDS